MPAQQIAHLICEGFDTFYAEFMRLTRAARTFFDAGDWLRLQEQQQARIDLYQRFVGDTLDSLTHLTRVRPRDLELWKQAHVDYADLVAGRVDVEVAETFFNAITRKIFNTVGVNAQIEFLEGPLGRHADTLSPGLLRRFAWDDDLHALLRRILSHPRPAIRWRHLHRDLSYLVARIEAECPLLVDGGRPDYVEVVKTLFFRPKEGYVVARIVRGRQATPLVIPVQSRHDGMVVDGVLLTETAVMPVFSSTRSYLFVDVIKPSTLVDFLGSLMPKLSRSELYIAIAHHRHGKSLIYRELVDHLRDSDDALVIAPGIRGLVMTVFTMPSYRNVFKIIRDEPEKAGVGRGSVLQSYRDVFRGQRVGRLADTQEFEFLAFDRARFEPACLQELQDKAPSQVWVEGPRVVIQHAYIEEKMTPLDLYLADASLDDAVRALLDYGTAIKELAAHNIFAGDLLWKNFGVNRFGRLVLYDYDEIRPLLDCNFRAIPPPRSLEDEMSAQPYYSVRENDVFPEEWLPFVAPRRPPPLREAFMDVHAELFEPGFWRGVQQDLVAGRVRVNLPYASRAEGS
ncbi:MAG: bifunctional isocitrate dehydrogenase kinase/phosphatase [Myxococcota bacterium]